MAWHSQLVGVSAGLQSSVCMYGCQLFRVLEQYWNGMRKLHRPIGETEGSKIRILFDLSAESVGKMLGNARKKGSNWFHIQMRVHHNHTRSHSRWDEKLEWKHFWICPHPFGISEVSFFFRYANSVEQIEWIVNSSNVICGSQHSSFPRSSVCVFISKWIQLIKLHDITKLSVTFSNWRQKKTYTPIQQKTPHESESQHDFSSLTATKRRWGKRNTDWSCWVRTYEWARRGWWWAWAMGRLESVHRFVSLSLPPKLNLVWEYWIWEMKAFKFRQYHSFPHSNLVYCFSFGQKIFFCVEEYALLFHTISMRM